MVSPDDLFRASCLLESQRLSFRLRTFESGVNVLESSDLDDEMIAQKTASILEQHAELGLTAMMMSKLESISALVAKEHLLVLFLWVH